jgi:hypothetical protein
MDGTQPHRKIAGIVQDLRDFTIAAVAFAHLSDKSEMRLQTGTRWFDGQAVQNRIEVGVHGVRLFLFGG